MKPRFPLSVERYFVYRAYQEYGDILESESFKSVFNRARCGLRCELSDSHDENSRMVSRFEFGYVTSYKIDETHFYEEWESLKRIGELYVTPVSEWFEKDYCVTGYEFTRNDYTERRR